MRMRVRAPTHTPTTPKDSAPRTLQGTSEAVLAAAADVALEEEDMHWSTDIIAVRCVEKMLDVLSGGWAAVQLGGWVGW